MTPLFVRKQAADRAFERLYKAHVRDIYRYALMVTRNPDDAEDIVQTTFLKAFRAYEAGDRPRQPRHWLIRIAHNTCRTRIRDAKRRPQEVALEDRLADVAHTHDYDGVRPTELLRALGALTFNQRAAIVMRELEGRSYAEIADVLDLSSSAVETLIFRARRALREQLEGSLDCGEAELALSLDLDGRLDRDERAQLRAHLRSCRECAGLARRQRARKAALGAFAPVPLPASLSSWGGGVAAGTGLAAKVAAVVVAGAAAAGAGFGAADALPDSTQARAEPAAAANAGAQTVFPAAFGVAFVRDLRASGRTLRVARDLLVDPTANALDGDGRTISPQSGPSVATTAVATVQSVTALVAVPELPQAPAVPTLPGAPAVAPPGLPPAPPLPVSPPPLPVLPPSLPEPPVPLPPLP